jgi:hypothetical protein
VIKSDLLKQIADAGYNIGFGAKKHFATFDIVEKAPGWIGFISTAVGIFSLFVDALASKSISAGFIVFGLSTFYINSYSELKNSYEEKGKLLTRLFDELKALYFQVKSSELSELAEEVKALSDIQSRYHAITISKQIFVSDWYAHYKFFWQHQIGWIDEQKHFKFWRDKVPLSLSLFSLLTVLTSFFLIARYLLCRGVL